MKKLINWLRGLVQNPALSEPEYKTDATDMIYIHDCLKVAAEWGLTTETVADALIALKNNPNLSITEAMNIGLVEWDI